MRGRIDAKAAAEGVRHAHARGRKVLVALNTYAQPGSFAR
jgi:collagenase-like PrtC family protease